MDDHVSTREVMTTYKGKPFKPIMNDASQSIVEHGELHPGDNLVMQTDSEFPT